jgi:hypothetical protein
VPHQDLLVKDGRKRADKVIVSALHAAKKLVRQDLRREDTMLSSLCAELQHCPKGKEAEVIDPMARTVVKRLQTSVLESAEKQSNATKRAVTIAAAIKLLSQKTWGREGLGKSEVQQYDAEVCPLCLLSQAPLRSCATHVRMCACALAEECSTR